MFICAHSVPGISSFLHGLFMAYPLALAPEAVGEPAVLTSRHRTQRPDLGLRFNGPGDGCDLCAHGPEAGAGCHGSSQPRTYGRVDLLGCWGRVCSNGKSSEVLKYRDVSLETSRNTQKMITRGCANNQLLL